MPLLAFNRKDTGGESIGSGDPWAADFASSTGKALHCGGIVTGAAGIGDRLTQLWLPGLFPGNPLLVGSNIATSGRPSNRGKACLD